MAAATADPTPELIEVLVHESTVVLLPGPRLDAASGAALVAAVCDACRGRATRVDIDLRELTSFTPEGAAALVRCRDAAGDVSEGLHYRTGRGPGRDALLAAYAV